MMEWLAANGSTLVAVAASLVSILVVSGCIRANRHRRIHNLNLAAELLEFHGNCVEQFTDNVAVPVTLRQQMLWFSQMISDESRFMELLGRVCDTSGGSSDKTAFELQLAELSQIDPSLPGLMRNAISSAVSAMILRTENASDMLDEHLARSAAYEQQRAAIFIQSSRSARPVPMVPQMASAAAA